MFSDNIPVLYCHSTAPQKHHRWVRHFLTLELKYFEDYLRFFTGSNYRSLFLDEYFEKRDSSTPDEQRSFCLTLDDGYLDNFVFAFPLLKKYGIKATIFVSPEFVDTRNILRKTLQDYWDNHAEWEQVDGRGFLSWEEMRLMQQSGLVDIQSHTLTHTKYFVSDKLTGFHHPGADCLYPVGNHFPQRKPYYMADPEFETLLPYGYPYFEEQSSVVARRVFINEEFNREVVAALGNINWHEDYDFNSAFQTVQPIYDKYRKDDSLIVRRETEREYTDRARQELRLSKDIIEKELQKEVEYCCWPHGDNNEFTHQTALEVGYKATTAGKLHFDGNLPGDRIPERIGLGVFMNSPILSRMRLMYKIKSFQRKQPYYGIKRIYEGLRYGG